MGRLRLLVILFLLSPLGGLLSGSEARAFIPPVDRTLNEIARVNRTSGRNMALQYDVTMSIGDRAPVASGQLISHPSGLARLELRGFGGRIDRYLLSGGELSGAKDGYALERPQPLLQPLFLLQPASRTTLKAALRSFDVRSDLIGLAPCGDQDCFVIGDPRLSAPLTRAGRSGSTRGDEGRSGIFGEDLSGPGFIMGSTDDVYYPRLWVDTEDLQVRRIDREDGVFTIFGPIVSYNKLMAPDWFEVHEPGAEAIRFEVDRVVQVNAPATAFSQSWLLAPVDSTPSEAGRASPPAAPPSPNR